ncbi:MAG: hypothetical protein J6V74_00785 [Bacteroidales bacterium]|nr:hypothetical protein [Bacteroidales bacterium]
MKEKQKRLNVMIDSVPHGRFREFQEKIAIETCTSIQTVYNWRTGRTEIPDLAMAKIEDIFKKF